MPRFLPLLTDAFPETVLHGSTFSPNTALLPYKSSTKFTLFFTSDENDDIIQNIFIKLTNGGLRNFNGATVYEFLAYFRKIAANEAFTWLRYKKRREREISIDPEPDSDNENTPSAPILADNTFRPDRAAEVKDLLTRVLEGLSIEEKQILVYKAEGYKDHEIAELLGIPMGTVASRYNRIKAGAMNFYVAVFLLIILGRK